MRRSTLAATVVVALGLACTDEPAPVGVAEPVAHEATASLVPCDPGLATHIRSQIVLLFPKGKSLRQAAQSQFDNIARKCRSARAEAQAKALALVSFTMTRHQNRQLTSAATPAAVAAFLSDVLAYVDLASAGAVSVVQPSTGGQSVVTADGQAGASFPPGAVSQPVVVVIAPSADQTDPLPTGFTQFPPFYDFVTSPAVTFGQPVTIGICVNYGTAPQAVLDRLQLARPDVTGGTTLELLPRVVAPFLDCPPLPGLSVAAGAEAAGIVARLFAAAAALVRPADLHAEAVRLLQFDPIGGLGSTVGNFGDNPVGTVDPVCASLAGIAQSHCLALVALYNTTDGPNWTNHTNWLQTSDVCTWYGVNCRIQNDGVPRELLLGSNNLRGVLPVEVGSLDSLRMLHLFQNDLSGQIPASLGGLPELQELVANHNAFSGAIPDELGSLGSLRLLFLNSNELSGPIPEALGGLGQLEVLAVNENQLTGPIPSALTNLGSLRSLRLQLNRLSGLVPLAVAQLGGRLEGQDPVSCSFTPGNELQLSDSPDYHAADLDGDGFICGLLVPTYGYVAVLSGWVSVIETVTRAEVARVPVGDLPQRVAITPGRDFVYVTNSNSDNVSVIRTSDRTVVATVAVGDYPYGVAVTPNGDFVYVTNSNSHDVSIIRTSDNTVVQSITAGVAPLAVAVTPDGGFAYVVNIGAVNAGPDTVSVIQASTNTVVGAIDVAVDPMSVAVGPSGDYVYVTVNQSGTPPSELWVIRTSDHGVAARVAVGGSPQAVAVRPQGDFVYVISAFDQNASVIRTFDNTRVTTVPVGGFLLGVAVTPKGDFVYVTNTACGGFTSGCVSVIATATNTVVGTILVGGDASGVAITSPE